MGGSIFRGSLFTFTILDKSNPRLDKRGSQTKDCTKRPTGENILGIAR